MRKSLTKIFWNIGVWAVQKHVNLVDLVKSCPTNIFLQNLVSIQKRTSLLKFVCICLNLLLSLCGVKASHHRRQNMWRRHQTLAILDENLLKYGVWAVQKHVNPVCKPPKNILKYMKIYWSNIDAKVCECRSVKASHHRRQNIWRWLESFSWGAKEGGRFG